jgi:hypothetical protein
MRTVLLLILLTITCSASAQNALDSIQLYGYPVRQGVIYKYEPKSNMEQACAKSLSIVSVVTPSDSVFHFAEGKVSGIFPVDDYYAIIVANDKGESVTYSNLKNVTLKKGDHVKRGMCLGTTGQCDSLSTSGLNQVDILILNKTKKVPYQKSVEYIRKNMSTKKGYTL